MKKYICTLIFFLASSHLYSQTEDPIIPLVETDKTRSATDNKYSVKAFIEFAGGVKKDGVIHFPSEKISIKYSSRSEKVSEDLSRIISIEFLKWKPAPLSKNSYRFNPASIRIHFNDESIYESGGNIPALNEFSFEKSGRKEKVYGYFFDYWKNGKWVNLKSEDKNFPLQNPLPGTVVKITLKKDKQELDLNKLLPKFFKQMNP